MTRPVMEAAEKILELARRVIPGADVAVNVRHGRTANTRFARNEITSSGDDTATVVTVGITVGRRHSETETNQTDEGSLKAALERAAAIVRLAPEDPEHMPLLGPQTYAAVPAGSDAGTEALGATDRARAIKAAIDEAERAKVVLAGFYSHHAHERAIANSAGLRGLHADSEASLSMTARTADATGSGWAGTEATRASEIDAKALAGVAVDKALRSASARALPAGRYTVVLEPAAVATLLQFLTDGLDARRADEGRSFFSKAGGGTRVGEKLFSEQVTLESDERDPLTPGAPFDGDGLPLKPVKWIDRGVLGALATSRYWAAKSNREPNAGHVVARLHGGSAERMDDLFAGVERGLLITRFWYTRWLDPKSLVITGLTRDGVFLIEGGKVTQPVRNFRFNDSPASVLKNVDLLTRRTVRPPVPGGLWHVPAIRTHDFNLASTSEAV